MKILDNINEIVRDDLISTIQPQGRISIAAAYFSIYAYQELRSQLEQIDELRFIFTSPTFVAEKASMTKRQLQSFSILPTMCWTNITTQISLPNRPSRASSERAR